MARRLGRGPCPGEICTRDYIDGRMTKTTIWSLISSYYENLSLPNSGPMKANTPWSGHYAVQPALWAIAHTTQFVPPGWQYVDSACGRLKNGGSCVRLRSPEASGDYSIVIETMAAKTPQTLSFRLIGGLATGPVHVWRSNQRTSSTDSTTLLRQRLFAIGLEPGCIYSLTTTTGQQKGKSPIRFRRRPSFRCHTMMTLRTVCRASCPDILPTRAVCSRWPTGPTAASACGRRWPGGVSTGTVTPTPNRTP